MGRSCLQTKFFLEGVCADADRAGNAPHVHLKQLLDGQQLLHAYAGIAESRKRPRAQRGSRWLCEEPCMYAWVPLPSWRVLCVVLSTLVCGHRRVWTWSSWILHRIHRALISSPLPPTATTTHHFHHSPPPPPPPHPSPLCNDQHTHVATATSQLSDHETIFKKCHVTKKLSRPLVGCKIFFHQPKTEDHSSHRSQGSQTIF